MLRRVFIRVCPPLLALAALVRTSPAHHLPAGVTLQDGQQFEYVVVGGGAAGAAAAARLALAGRAVLLLEAGADPHPLSWIPSAAPSLIGSAMDWQYKTIPNYKSCLSAPGGRCRASRGRCLGGSTSINHMIYTRGHPHDWDSLGIPGWTWEDIKPYFLRYEGFKDLNFLPISSTPYHNTNGTMNIQFFEESGNPWHSRTIEGYLQLNFPYNRDVNAASQTGVTRAPGYVQRGLRVSTARGYLSRHDVKSKLKIAKSTRCVRVIVDNENVARGVTVVTGSRNKTLNLYVTREVILSAGAISTPQILMMSGIGHAGHLNSLNISVRMDLPVGDEMTDHILPLIFIKVDSDSRAAKVLTSAVDAVDSLSQFLESAGGPLASIGLTDINVFANTLCYDYKYRQLNDDKPECELPTMQIIHSFAPRGAITASGSSKRTLNLNEDVLKQLADANARHALLVVSPIILQPKSKGYVRLASRNPLDDPEIFPNLLSNDHDMEEMIRAIRIIEDLVETRPFKKRNASVLRFRLKGCPTYESGAAGYWACYGRHLTQPIHHGVGTGALGRVLERCYSNNANL